MTPVERLPSPCIFIAHSPDDASLARELRDKLVNQLSENTPVVLSEEIPMCDDWYSTVDETLRAAAWFILVMNTRAPGLDWCLYEAGIYQGLHGDDGQIICLHHPDERVPEMLSGAELVEATPTHIDELAEKVRRRPWSKSSGPTLRLVGA